MTTILQSKDYSGKVVLYMAMELSNAKWKLGFSNGSRDRGVTIIAGDWKALSRQIDLAKEKLHLPENCPVISCFEAGRDFGFTVSLERFGITNLILIVERVLEPPPSSHGGLWSKGELVWTTGMLSTRSEGNSRFVHRPSVMGIR